MLGLGPGSQGLASFCCANYRPPPLRKYSSVHAPGPQRVVEAVGRFPFPVSFICWRHNFPVETSWKSWGSLKKKKQAAAGLSGRPPPLSQLTESQESCLFCLF